MFALGSGGYFSTTPSKAPRARRLIEGAYGTDGFDCNFHQSKEFCQTRLKVEWD